MEFPLSETESVCPVCLAVIPATLLEDGRKVYMEKECVKHGRFRSLLRNDPAFYSRISEGSSNPEPLANSVSGDCTLRECGLCSSHLQHTCLAVIELTNRCNLRCKICFSSSEHSSSAGPDIDTLTEMYRAVLNGNGRSCPVQLSGGEPFMRRDLREIVEVGRDLKFENIQVNTNGIALAKRPALVKEMAQAGVKTVYLQFDGVDDGTYSYIRDAELLRYKIDAIRNCGRNGIAVVLVPTVVKGVNDDKLGDILRFAAEQETVVGVNLQPVTLMGRYPAELRKQILDRVTIPDITEGIEVQTGGELLRSDFHPIPCPDPRCSTLTVALVKEGRMIPLSRFIDVESTIKSIRNPETMVSKAVSKLWSVSPDHMLQEVIERTLSLFEVERDESFPPRFDKLLTISAMAFQDCWTLDLKRLIKCCIHVVSQDGCLIPFCAYYLTDTGRHRLYRL